MTSSLAMPEGCVPEAGLSGYMGKGRGPTRPARPCRTPQSAAWKLIQTVTTQKPADSGSTRGSSLAYKSVFTSLLRMLFQYRPSKRLRHQDTVRSFNTVIRCPFCPCALAKEGRNRTDQFNQIAQKPTKGAGQRVDATPACVIKQSLQNPISWNQQILTNFQPCELRPGSREAGSRGFECQQVWNHDDVRGKTAYAIQIGKRIAVKARYG